MFCKKCGSEIAPGATFCATCGAPVEAAEQPVQAPAAPAATPYAAPAAAAAPAAKKSPIPLIACILVVVLLIVGLASCFTGNPKSVAKKYYTDYLNCNFKAAMNNTLFDAKTVEKMLKQEAKDNGSSMDELYEAAGQIYDKKIKNFKDLIKVASEKAKEDKEDTYGKYKVSVEIRTTEKLDKDDLKQIREQIDDDDTLSKYYKGKKVKAGYKIKLKYKIKGKDKDSSDTVTLTVIKYGGKWKVLSESILNSLF